MGHFLPQKRKEAGGKTNERKVLELLTKALEVPVLWLSAQRHSRHTGQTCDSSGTKERTDMIHGAVTCSSIILNSHPLYV